jgi:hypothetical protein
LRIREYARSTRSSSSTTSTRARAAAGGGAAGARDGRFVAAFAALSTAAYVRSSGRGRIAMNSAPRPWTDSTTRSPPSRRRICREIERPSPVPSSRFVV